MKKLLLSSFGILAALQLCARDFSYEYKGQTLFYTVVDEAAKTCRTRVGDYKDNDNIVAGNAISGDLVIPSIAKNGNVEYTVISIGNEAFSGCTALTSVKIPTSVTSIGEMAFGDCSGLTLLDIPASVTSIGDWAFRGCSGLTSVTIPNSVTSIRKYAFGDCNALTSVKIPASVTYIGVGAFNSCAKLTSINVDSENPEYSAADGIIYNKKGTRLVAVAGGLTSVTIPNSVTSISNYAFGGCSSLTSVTVPASVTSIGVGAFRSCAKLTSINVDSENPEYSSVNGVLYDKKETNLVAVAGALTSVDIPGSVTSVGNWSFSGCTGLTSVNIPASVTSVGEYAFSGCTGLTSVIIPASVTSIGEYAFSGCSGLTDIYMYNPVPTEIAENAFSDYSATLHVLEGHADAYKSAPVWSEFTIKGDLSH